MVKIKMKRSELKTDNDIWNVVLSAYGKYDFPTNDEKMDDFFILFNYYCEVESGGHECLFNWFSKDIEKMGIQIYLNRLMKMLQKVDAHDYAKLEKNYLVELWTLFLAVENSGNDELKFDSVVADFYNLLEKAEAPLPETPNGLADRLSSYATDIYTEIIEIME